MKSRINRMLKYFAKKYVLRLVNNVIKSINIKIGIKKYINSIKRIIEYLNKLLSYLDDMEITSEESEALIKDSLELFKELK